MNFDGLHVAALESRRADDMTRLIEKCGGVPHVSPSMREVPIEPNRPAIDFAHRVMVGEISVVVLNTGVGFRYLMKAITPHVDAQRFLDSLSDITTVCRGPKPVAALREFGLRPTHRVPEPNTWRDVLQTIDAHVAVANQTVGVQEYGVSNASLVAGLEARGASVQTVKVYGWEFPESTDLLQENITAIAAGQRDVLLLTSAHQIVNIFRMAEQMGIADGLRDGLSRVVISSIGPTTSAMLSETDLPVHFEPSHPKMGHLVTETAKNASELMQKVKPAAAKIRTAMKPIDNHPSQSSLFMMACRGEPTPRTPVWLMRQAGRYMGEYREVRAKTTFLDLCKNPPLCSEVMCTAVDRLGVDAAIIFSDLLPILEPMGLDLEFLPGDGPTIHNPIRSAEDVGRVQTLKDDGSLDFVYETVRQTRADLPADMPLIGFAGAPFTLASYAIEGGGSRTYLHTKQIMRSSPAAWATLMERLVDGITMYLNHQIAAGAQVVQVFDSWAGCLSTADYETHVLPWMRRLIGGVTPGVPVINFATGNPELLSYAKIDDRTVVGVDWRIDLDTAWRRLGYETSVQGNLDPTVLLSDPETIREQAKRVLDAAGGRPGHIFNLGHGVLQQTPPEHAIELVRFVKEYSARKDPS